MRSIAESRTEFGPFDGRIWLNVAHQGPLPRVARRALELVADDKAAPHRILDDSFWEVPERLKTWLANLIGSTADEIVLGNSATHGLHVLAHGLPLKPGDEILLVEGDFPATVVPWLWLRRRGVRLRLIERRTRLLDIAQLAEEISERTRVLCSSWVFSLSGEAIDIDAVGKLCHDRSISFVINATQALGARPFDVRRSPIDALVSSGFKWLLGPYGTGFAWIRPELLQRLDYHQDYWLTQMDQTDLSQEGSLQVRDGLSASRYDVFGTANFFNFVPWIASLELLAEIGIETVADHDQQLVDALVSGLDGSRRLSVVSPMSGPARSTIVMIAHTDPSMTKTLHARLQEEGIDSALRAGKLRLSPHLHNDQQDIETTLRVLAGNA